MYSIILVKKWRQILTRQQGCMLHLLCQIVNNSTMCKPVENQTPYVLKSAEPFICFLFLIFFFYQIKLFPTKAFSFNR